MLCDGSKRLLANRGMVQNAADRPPINVETLAVRTPPLNESVRRKLRARAFILPQAQGSVTEYKNGKYTMEVSQDNEGNTLQVL